MEKEWVEEDVWVVKKVEVVECEYCGELGHEVSFEKEDGEEVGGRLKMCDECLDQYVGWLKSGEEEKGGD